MRKFTLLLLTIFTTALLSGCGDTYNQIKEAAAGIHSKANEATTAISADVHAIRATEITYVAQTFTINDVFKTILRDVQWFYAESTNELTITGTWQNNGLFAELRFDEETVKALLQEGEVEVILTFDNGVLVEPATQVTFSLQDDDIIYDTGTDILHHLYDVYIGQ